MSLADARTILELHSDATETQMKLAFKRFKEKNHPDNGGDAKYYQWMSDAFDVMLGELTNTYTKSSNVSGFMLTTPSPTKAN